MAKSGPISLEKRYAGRMLELQRLEDAARKFLARRARRAREARDLEILNAAADDLNREMADVLAYQVDL